MKKETVVATSNYFYTYDVGAIINWGGKYKYQKSVILKVVNETTLLARRYFDIFDWLKGKVWVVWMIIRREWYYWWHSDDPETRWYKSERKV